VISVHIRRRRARGGHTTTFAALVVAAVLATGTGCAGTVTIGTHSAVDPRLLGPVRIAATDVAGRTGRLVILTGPTRSDLHLVPLAVPWPGQYARATGVSPDHNRIAYTTSRSGDTQPQVFTADLTSGRVRQLTSQDGWRDAAFLDSERIVAVHTTGDVDSIRELDLSSRPGAGAALVTGAPGEALSGPLAVGGRVLFVRTPLHGPGHVSWVDPVTLATGDIPLDLGGAEPLQLRDAGAGRVTVTVATGPQQYGAVLLDVARGHVSLLPGQGQTTVSPDGTAWVSVTAPDDNGLLAGFGARSPIRLLADRMLAYPLWISG
jgi:hypothetical protein